MTYTGWADPPPDREGWYEAASELGGKPERLTRSSITLYDGLGEILEEWTGEQPQKPEDRPLLLCDWGAVWEVETDRESLRINELKWLNGLAPAVGDNRPDCLEEEGPAIQLV